MMIFAMRILSGSEAGRRRRAYTLVEILVVLFVLMLVAAIALPTVKDLLSNQKTSRAARNLVAFIDKVRSRAIAEQRPFGVLIESGVGRPDALSMSQSVRVRQLAGIPPYSGDASDAYAELRNHPNQNMAYADFPAQDNSLLALSRKIIFEDNRPDQAPIRNGDYLELPGGRMVNIYFAPLLPKQQNGELDPLDQIRVRVEFSLTDDYPEGQRSFSSAAKVKYRIHRRPVISASTSFSMPRGVVIDLNFSGVGLTQNNFCPIIPQEYDPFADPPVLPTGGDVEIIFGADGSIQRVTKGSNFDTGTSQWVWGPEVDDPRGTIFLCIGDADGLFTEPTGPAKKPPNEGLFSTEKKNLSNLLNLESIWVTVNPYTGRANSSPMSPVTTTTDGIGIPPLPSPPADSNWRMELRRVLEESRKFAVLTDFVDTE